MKGSFTVEMSLLFPMIFLMLMICMQFGLYYSYRIYSQAVVQQSLLICTHQRQQGIRPEKAAAIAESYLQDQLQQLPIAVEAAEVKQSVNWLNEEYQAGFKASYTLFISLSWSETQKKEWMNPVLLRNRVDFIWEKGKAYFDPGGD